MDYKNNADILSWKRVIQNLQDRTNEGVKEYNEAQEKVTEAVGEFAEPLYTLQDELGLEDNILVDELARWMSGQDIADFVADFRSDHDMNENVKEEKVTEGTWSIPDTPEKVRELKDLMKQELPADEAQDKIYGILGDDELFDDIAEMEEKDPKADVRGMIVRRLDDLGLIKKKVNETTEALTEEQFDEAAGEKDACYHKVKSRYKIWPSAYASGALTQCRKKGAKNWGNSKK
jgi:hypothetical protein